MTSVAAHRFAGTKTYSHGDASSSAPRRIELLKNYGGISDFNTPH